jgi:serine/threonine protein phosphatase PrpC
MTPTSWHLLVMLHAFGLTDIGCVRHNNEDVFRLEDDVGLYLVSDGMGGAEAGEVAANLAAEAVVTHFRLNPTKSVTALCQSFEEAHQCVLNAAAHDEQIRGMGCTLVAALCDQQTVYIANVGDSRAYAYADGACEYISSDQTWVNEVGRKLGLSAEELKKHHLRHVLTIAVGSEGPFRVNSATLPLNKDTRILLCTDGLHDVVSDCDIAEIMTRKGPSDWKCHLLVQAAREAGGPDNITVTVLQNGS